MGIAARMNEIKPSATLTITSKAKSMKAEGIDVISFGAGEPDFDTPDYIKNAAIEAIKKGKTKYTPSIGDLQLRQGIAEKLQSQNNLAYDATDIAVSNGAKHALYNIFQVLCNPGDEVIISAPYWVSYPEMVRLSGASCVFAQTTKENGFKMDVKLLKSRITDKTKAVIINSPNNPTGCVYSKQELRPLVELAISRHIAIVSDEIYERLIYGNIQHASVAGVVDDAIKNTILVNGVSKTYSMTGWRIGYVASKDKDFLVSYKKLQDHSSSNPCSISQAAALTALKKEDSSVEDMKRAFQQRRDYMLDRIKSIELFSCVKPDGAFYCFIDVNKVNRDSLAFASKLLDEAKVAVIPGEGFGAAGHIRMSFATGMEQIKNGFDRIEKWLRQ